MTQNLVLFQTSSSTYITSSVTIDNVPSIIYNMLGVYNPCWSASSLPNEDAAFQHCSPSFWSTSTVTGVDALPMKVTLPFITSAMPISSWCSPGSGSTKSSLKQFELSKGVIAMVKPLLASAAENISMLVVLFSACEENAKHPFAVMPTRTKKKAFHHAQRLIASHAARGHTVTRVKIQEQGTNFHWRRAKCLLPGQYCAAVADVLPGASHYHQNRVWTTERSLAWRYL